MKYDVASISEFTMLFINFVFQQNVATFGCVVVVMIC